jgi:hypothetical protein
MNVHTFDLIVWFRNYERHYHNISRTAVNYYVRWHEKNPDYQDFSITNA